MELKAVAGDQDLYDVLKKQKRKQKQQDAKAANQYRKDGEKVSVFDIINKKLGHKKGRCLRNLIRGKVWKMDVKITTGLRNFKCIKFVS